MKSLCRYITNRLNEPKHGINLAAKEGNCLDWISLSALNWYSVRWKATHWKSHPFLYIKFKILCLLSDITFKIDKFLEKFIEIDWFHDD